MPTKKAVKTTTSNPISDLERRILQLEQRPTVFQLDPDSSYVVIVPEATTPDEYDSLCSAVSKFDNVFVIQADNIKFLQVN